MRRKGSAAEQIVAILKQAGKARPTYYCKRRECSYTAPWSPTCHRMLWQEGPRHYSRHYFHRA